MLAAVCGGPEDTVPSEVAAVAEALVEVHEIYLDGAEQMREAVEAATRAGETLSEGESAARALMEELRAEG